MYLARQNTERIWFHAFHAAGPPAQHREVVQIVVVIAKKGRTQLELAGSYRVCLKVLALSNTQGKRVVGKTYPHTLGS